MAFVGCGALKYISMSDQECKIRPAVMKFNLYFILAVLL